MECSGEWRFRCGAGLWGLHYSLGAHLWGLRAVAAMLQRCFLTPLALDSGSSTNERVVAQNPGDDVSPCLLGAGWLGIGRFPPADGWFVVSC
jgi:hypothetical protein